MTSKSWSGWLFAVGFWAGTLFWVTMHVLYKIWSGQVFW